MILIINLVQMRLLCKLPVGVSEDFTGIIDVLTRKMATFEGEMGIDC